MKVIYIPKNQHVQFIINNETGHYVIKMFADCFHSLLCNANARDTGLLRGQQLINITLPFYLHSQIDGTVGAMANWLSALLASGSIPAQSKHLNLWPIDRFFGSVCDCM